MVKLSLAIMVGLTVVIAVGLRWREERAGAPKPGVPAARRGGGLAEGWIAAQKRKLNRWITAAALAALATMLLLGGLNWLRIWNG